MADQSSIWRSLRRNSSPPSISNTVLPAGQTDQPEAGQDTQTEKERQTDRTGGETERQNRDYYREKDIQKESQTDRMINRQVDGEKDRQETDRAGG